MYSIQHIMWQTKEKSIFPTIFLVCFMLVAFVFIIFQNVASADTPKTIKYTNDSVSDFVLEKATNLLTTNLQDAKEKYENTFDIESDYSFQKYVSDKNVLQNKQYEPADLIELNIENIVNKAARPYLRQAAATAFDEMTENFYKEFWEKIYVTSAYRTYQDQVRLFDGWCSTIRCAKIWASEHQLGLAVDIHVATKYWYTHFSAWYLDWMNENAYKYGFINTYSKWPKVDWKMKEIRHRRYVWVPFATELHEKDMSFAERVNEE